MFADVGILRWTESASAWLLTYVVHSTLLIGAVWFATSWKRMRDTTRDVLWRVGLVGGLVTASIQTAVGHQPLGGQLRLGARPAEAQQEVRVAVRETVVAERAFIVAHPKSTRWTAAIVVVWLAGAGAALLWLTIAHARAGRALGDRTSLDGAPIASRLQWLLARAGVRREVELTCSANAASPVALVNGEVCLPRRALVELDAEEQESMLAHEIAHVVRRDPQWLLAARVIEAVLFIQPLNALARRRMQAVAEFLCDDWAVQRTSQPVMLARCLAAVAEWVARGPRLHAMSAMVESGGSPLVQRVRRILGGGHAMRAASSRGALVASACVLVAVAAGAPRVSIASDAITHRTITFVRAIVDRNDGPAPLRGRLMILDSDSLGLLPMWTRPLPAPIGAAAGARVLGGGPRARMIVIERLK
jgi:beta-lactamase regulating signal transducer with metallopeptidase domain